VSGHYVRSAGLGWGWLGRTHRLTNDQYWILMMQGRIRLGLAETARRHLWNKAVEQYESQRHPGADAAAISFDDA